MSAPETFIRHTHLAAAAPQAVGLSQALLTLLDTASEAAPPLLISMRASASLPRVQMPVPTRPAKLPTVEAVKRRYDDEDEEDDELDGFGEDDFDDFDEDEDDFDDFDEDEDDFDDFDEDEDDVEEFDEDLEDDEEFEDRLAYVVI
ncbi:MAG: hypothetical protein OHK0023_25520 [Anaerolineae bacterium]